MKLNKKETDVLSMIDDQLVEDFLNFALKNTKYSEKIIKKAIIKLINEKYIEIIYIPQGEIEKGWYFRTKKGESVKLNDNLRYIGNYGHKFAEKDMKNGTKI